LTAIDPDKLVTARKCCTELFHRTMMSQATVTSGLEFQKTFPDVTQQLMQNHLNEKSYFRQFFVDFLSPLDEDEFPKISERLAIQTAVNLETIVSASMIVLSHSTADDVFTAICGLSIDLMPEKWESELNLARKVSLGDVFDKGIEAIKAVEMDHLRSRLGNKSLPNRARLLFKRLPIRLHRDIPKDETSYYTESRLLEVDELRHKIIHGGKLSGLNLKEGIDATHFLHEAAYTAIRSMLARFGLTIDFKLLGKLVGAPKPSV
jgi:hypothetical protein